MTKEEILNGMSEEEFYDMYPTQEDWENSQQMKLGGLSGAPHNGQPTANEFFSYGSHVNDGLNIPMSNPFYAAHGGTYYGGPTSPYDMGGNTASPMNYGAFNVPMQYGGYEQEYGGSLDESNNQDYPILEEGGRAALMAMIKAHSKKMRKAYKDGGDTVMQGGNSTDYPTTMRDTFKNVLKQNIQNHMINEEEKSLSEEMMQVGGYAGGPGMNYNNTNFSQPNQQNQALANMYQQRIGATKDNLSNDFSNLGNATNYLGATANPYQKTSVKAQTGTETGKQRTLSEEEWSWLDEQRKAKENKADYNKYFGENRTSTRGMNYAPMNYNPYTKISKKDDALFRQIAANPSSNLKEYKNINLPFGFGRTKMTFGYKDLYEDKMKVKEIPTSLNNIKNKNQTKDLGPYPESSEYDGVLDNYQHGELFPKVYKPGMSPADFMPSNLQGTPSTTPVDVRSYDWENKIGFPAERKSTMLDMPKKYGGGLKKYQGNVSGSQVDFDPNDKTPIKMEPISATPGFSNYVNEQGLKLQGQQSHLKDPETGSMFSGPEKKATVTTKNRPGFDKEAMANWSIAGMNTISGILEQGDNAKNKKQLSNLQLADNAFVATPANAQSRGDYDPNSGMFRMDQMNPVQFPGGMGYSAYGGSFQDGGMQEQAAPQQEQIMQGVATMLQQGAQPEQVAQQLVQMGIPQEQAIQIIQTVMQQMQGGQEQSMQPAMRYGGYAMGGYQEDEESYEDDLDEDEIDELRRQGYNIEYLD